MIYRTFGKAGLEISQLGFGCMRFPLTRVHDPTSIDEEKSTRMLQYAIDNGINLLDSAWPYHRETSERFIGRTLSVDYRKKVYFSTKLPIWLIKNKEDPQKYFNEQLKRLNSRTIELYLLHALGKKSWPTVREYDVLKFLDDLKTIGKIKQAGFSFHDELPLFKEIIDAYAWDFCLIHLNYVDDDLQAGLAGLEYAHNKGLSVMIMEPLRGGKLANKVPEEVLDLIGQTGRRQSPAEFALRWIYNRPEVSCILSGMSALDQVETNIKFASIDHRHTLTPDELAIYEKAKKFYRARTVVNCTQCGYCQPCAQGIPISFILELYNDAYMYDAIDNSGWMYEVFIKPENRADKCTECGECEEKCPQKIKIADHLAKAHKFLSR